MNQQIHSQEASFANAIVAELNQAAAELPHEITERLRAARVQALAKSRDIAPAPMPVSLGTTLALGSGMGMRFWSQLTTWFTMATLVVGFIAMVNLQEEDFAQELADVDAELLTDDLPPVAFTDPGFAQYLRVSVAP